VSHLTPVYWLDLDLFDHLRNTFITQSGKISRLARKRRVNTPTRPKVSD
jgi:hypothetical protein